MNLKKNDFLTSIKNLAIDLGPIRLAALSGVVVSIIGFGLYIATLDINSTSASSFRERNFISGVPSAMACFNSDGKEVYQEDFPRGMVGERPVYRTLTVNNKRVWVYTVGSLMCREVEK